MSDANISEKDRLVLAACPLAAEYGWSAETLHKAAHAAGVAGNSVDKLFPRGAIDAVLHLADWADREMLAALTGGRTEATGVRASIHLAVMTRLRALQPYRGAVKQSMALLLKPWHLPCAKRMSWRSADTIWGYAGDTSTDYNFYTKRALLSGVLMAVMPYWLCHTDDETAAFLAKRLDNVVAAGRFMAKFADSVISRVVPKRAAR